MTSEARSDPLAGFKRSQVPLAHVEFEAFCQRHYAELCRALYLYCGNADLAEDVAQETMARAYAQWNRRQNIASLEGWTFRVGTNLIKSHFRRKRTERRALSNETETADSQEQQVITALTIHNALGQLPQRQRVVLILRYFLDLSVAETAELMRCPEGTVKTLTRRGLGRLESLIGQIQGEDHGS